MVINKINLFLNQKNGRKEKKLELQVGDQALVFFFLEKVTKKKRKKQGVLRSQMHTPKLISVAEQVPR